MTNHEQQARIATRLKALREQRKLSQMDLTAELGFSDRQTLAAIEAGERSISPEELVRAAKALEVDLDTFLDPYRLIGEGKFSFRASTEDPKELAAFQDQAGRWIATYRELSVRYGSEPSPLGLRLELFQTSSFEDAAEAGEALWRAWDLGDVPAERLEDAIERQLGVLVLYVDAPDTISGAASRLPKYNTILLNRNEPPGRRAFDLAHELFHILTWEAMPPKKVEPLEPRPVKGNRVEYLAENFAAALLLPSPIIIECWQARAGEEIERWISRTASELRVSTRSLQWRLVNLGVVSKSEAGVDRPAPRAMGTGGGRQRPLLFSTRFVRLVAKAVDEGRLSLRRAAKLLGLRVADFAELCEAHGCTLAYDLVS